MEPHLQFWWDAFWDLSGDRQVFIGGVGRIPLQAMDCWAGRYGVEGRDEFDAFKTVMRAMDDVFVAHVAAKAERERKAKK